MPAGPRRHRITVQEPTETPDGADVTVAWTERLTCQAAITPTGGSELFRNRQLAATITHLVEVASTPATRAVTPSMRVLWRGRLLEIRVAMDRDERHTIVEWHCTERVAT
jgi:SPP1 family predicted phage head-tail adaptor